MKKLYIRIVSNVARVLIEVEEQLDENDWSEDESSGIEAMKMIEVKTKV